MKKLLIAVITVTLALVLSGCYSIKPYSPIAKQDFSAYKVNVGEFRDKIPEKFNKVNSFAVPADEMTHAEYIRKAFIEELQTTGAFSESSQVTLTADVNKVYHRGGVDKGYWDFSIIVYSSNGKSLKVEMECEYESVTTTSFIITLGVGTNLRVMARATNAFPSAVQNLIQKAMTSPEFKELLK